MFKLAFKIMKKYLNFIFKLDLYTDENFYIKESNLSNLSSHNIENEIIYNRCKRDPIYFFENCVDSNIKINDCIKQFIDSFINKKTLVVHNQRAIGLTTGYLILTTWLLTFYPCYKMAIILPSNIHVHNFKISLFKFLESIKYKNMKQSFTYYNGENVIKITENLSECKLITNLNHLYGEMPVNTIFVDNAEMFNHTEELFKSFYMNELLEYCNEKDFNKEHPYIPHGVVLSSSFGNRSNIKNIDFLNFIFDNHKKYGFEEYLTLKMSDK